MHDRQSDTSLHLFPRRQQQISVSSKMGLEMKQYKTCEGTVDYAYPGVKVWMMWARRQPVQGVFLSP